MFIESRELQVSNRYRNIQSNAYTLCHVECERLRQETLFTVYCLNMGFCYVDLNF